MKSRIGEDAAEAGERFPWKAAGEFTPESFRGTENPYICSFPNDPQKKEPILWIDQSIERNCLERKLEYLIVENALDFV